MHGQGVHTVEEQAVHVVGQERTAKVALQCPVVMAVIIFEDLLEQPPVQIAFRGVSAQLPEEMAQADRALA